MPHSIHKHLQYNIWANGKMSDLLESLDEEILYTEVQSSFSTLEKTLLHIWGAEGIWLKRLQRESPTHFHTQDFTGNKAALLNGFRRSSKDLFEYIEGKDAGFLQEVISFKTMKGDPYSSPVDEILYHVVNHGAFHRGQIVTILRELRVTMIPQTDLIFYLRS